MKSIKEMFTRKKAKRNWILEFECPVEMASHVVDTLGRVGVETSISSYHCDSKVKIIAAEFVLNRDETDEEIIERAEAEFADDVRTFNEIVRIYTPGFAGRAVTDGRREIEHHMRNVFDARKELFKRGAL